VSAHINRPSVQILSSTTATYLIIIPYLLYCTQYQLLSRARGISGRRGDSDIGKKKSRQVARRGIERGEGNTAGVLLTGNDENNDDGQVNLAEPPQNNDIDLWDSYGYLTYG
jgi:hypothetical protein